MGYFSTGSQGGSYQDAMCCKCTNWPEEGECPIWALHKLYNDKQHDSYDVEAILNIFIPRSEDRLHNLKCEMFNEDTET